MEHISKLMPEVKKEQALTEHKPSEIGKTNLELALKSNLVKNDLDGLQKVLKYVMLLVGLRANNLPDELEKTVLINYIQAHYGGHTISEIRLAFELAINGQLDIEDAKCYENFSVLFFSTIMNAYRKWSSQEYKQVIKSDPPKQVVLTDEQLRDIHREDFEKFYQRMRNGWIPPSFPEYFNDILRHDGLVKDGESVMDWIAKRLGSGCQNIYIKQ